MKSVKSAITNTIPISQFNRGMAGQIFSDVRTNGTKVVMKNNQAEAVIMSPDKYVELMDRLEEYHDMIMAAKRLNQLDPSTLIPLEEIDHEFGITKEELEATDDVEFE